VTRRKICSRLEPASARSARDAEFGEGTVNNLPAPIHDDHASADLLNQMQQVRREQDRRAGPAARQDRFPHPPDAERIEAG
jgi:hypothetical protein